MFRPSLEAKQVLIVLNLLETEHITNPSTDTLRLIAVFRKLAVNIDLGIGVSYVGVTDAERIKTHSISIASLTEMASISKSLEVSDKDKLAAMSPKGEALFWLETEREFISSELYAEKLAAINRQYPSQD